MEQLSRTPTLKIRLIGYTLFAAFFLAVVTTIEIAGWICLKRMNMDTYRLLVKRGEIPEGEGWLDTRDNWSQLDPHLSHSYNPSKLKERGFTTIPGFAVFGETENPAALTIVTLGGSTTEALADANWPQMFAESLNAEGFPAKVLNGGVAGYSSNQELLKLIRDVLPLQPDLIISLSGINDLGFLHSTRNNPMVHPYQKRVITAASGRSQVVSTIMPNAVGAVLAMTDRHAEVGLNWGTIVKRKDYEQWHSNIRMMHAISSEFGIPYLCFLQPVLGEGEYDISADEQEMLDETLAKLAPRRDYLSDVREFYEGAKKLSSTSSYVIDITKAFVGKQGIYRDSRHQTEAGCGVLAESILEHCKALNVLSKRENL